MTKIWLPIYKFSKRDSILFADDDFQDCNEEFASNGATRQEQNNTSNNVTHHHQPHHSEICIQQPTKDAARPNNANTNIAIQTAYSTDASTQTGNDELGKNSKSSKSSCIIS